MKTKLTPWFPIRLKPARNGVYETRFISDGIACKGYSLFRGMWSNQYASKRLAANSEYSGKQEKQWHGLAEKP